MLHFVKPRRLARSFAVLALLLAASPAAASITVALDLAELVAASEAVVVATVVDRRSQWDSERRIVTDVTLRIDDTMKGHYGRGEDIVVRRLGGAIGDLGMRVEGEPTFSDGERAVLFAERVGAHLRPVGMSQGVLRVRLSERGQELVHPGVRGLELVRRAPTGTLVPAPAYLIEARPLADVMDEIRQAVERESAR
jgi:hypothetical protein